MENKKRKKSTNVSSLSSKQVNEKIDYVSIEDIENKIFNEINNAELQKSLMQWEKDFRQKQNVSKRDFSLLKSIVSEYMNTFLLFGYNIDDERVIIQKFDNARDRDAIMEFLKTIFIKQQTENFLD